VFTRAVDILDETDKDEQFLYCVIFSDEATFHVSAHVRRDSVRIWANERPHDFHEHERDRHKVNVLCVLTRYRVIVPYNCDITQFTSTC
jgi:hypothetical protein